MNLHRGGRKSWEGKTLQPGVTYKKGITETWLKQNFQKYYPRFYKAITTEEDIWHEVPVGGKIDVMGLKKIENDTFVTVHIGMDHKCAFAAMANALYEIHDIQAATFFHENLDEDRDVLTSILNTNHYQTYKENDFMLALKLLQTLFGYQMEHLKKNDNTK